MEGESRKREGEDRKREGEGRGSKGVKYRKKIIKGWMKRRKEVAKPLY